ncbi:putative protein phosphatase 2C 63 [Senna tora]|uniref:protein-serine/threonine phosphatase n=1 Tax=Senna tora TaxID=362788 RepID=A0A834W6D9_9FABA|nr:putative protein phosphatase 2C 63 [Senna tora]
MLRSCYSSLKRCFGRAGVGGDGLLWHTDLKPHASGDFSIAVAQANLRLEDQSQVFTSPSATYIGVYDGHGGPEASRFVNKHLFRHLDEFSVQNGGLSVDVIKKAFNVIEEDFLRHVKRKLHTTPKIASVGSCCLLGAISDNVLYIANLGDSRVVLGRKTSHGEKHKVVAQRLSTDHNVAVEEVRKEVESLHPDDAQVVVFTRGTWRIKGIIQVSRSIGDVYLKKPEFYSDPIFQKYGNPIPLKRPVMTAEPSVLVKELEPQDSFLIFASDGLWEQLTDEEAVEIVYKHPRAISSYLWSWMMFQGIAKRLALHQTACLRGNHPFEIALLT